MTPRVWGQGRKDSTNQRRLPTIKGSLASARGVLIIQGGETMLANCFFPNSALFGHTFKFHFLAWSKIIVFFDARGRHESYCRTYGGVLPKFEAGPRGLFNNQYHQRRFSLLLFLLMIRK